MPRVFKRKTERHVDETQIKRALKDHFRNKVPVREVARLYDINRSTLMSRIKKIRSRGREQAYQNSDSGLSDDENVRKFQNKYTSLQVLSTEEENDLVRYIIQCSDLNYGLSYRQIRELAYEYAVNNPLCRYPRSWRENQIAGKSGSTFLQ